MQLLIKCALSKDIRQKLPAVKLQGVCSKSEKHDVLFLKFC